MRLSPTPSSGSAVPQRPNTEVDILVNNAGATWGAPAEDHPIEAWDKVMNVNVRGVFLFSQDLARRCMIPQRYGRILMIASVTGFRGNLRGHDTVAYNTSKAAVMNLTRALAGEWGEYGITVNALAPGWFPSRMTAATLAAKGEDMVTRVPLGRLGDDEDLEARRSCSRRTPASTLRGRCWPWTAGFPRSADDWTRPFRQGVSA